MEISNHFNFNWLSFYCQVDLLVSNDASLRKKEFTLRSKESLFFKAFYVDA